MEEPTIKLQPRRSGHVLLKNYDSYSVGTPDFLEVTEWTNGLGFDVTIGIQNKEDKTFHLTYGQYNAIQDIIINIDK